MDGPDPTHPPEFPGEFVSEAKSICSRPTAEHRLWQRARMVVLLNRDRKMSCPQLAEEVGLYKTTVRLWKKRCDGGDFSFQDRSGRGRKPKLDRVFGIVDNGSSQRAQSHSKYRYDLCRYQCLTGEGGGGVCYNSSGIVEGEIDERDDCGKCITDLSLSGEYDKLAKQYVVVQKIWPTKFVEEVHMAQYAHHRESDPDAYE